MPESSIDLIRVRHKRGIATRSALLLRSDAHQAHADRGVLLARVDAMHERLNAQLIRAMTAEAALAKANAVIEALLYPPQTAPEPGQGVAGP